MAEKVRHRRGKVYPVWNRTYSEELGVDVARIVGYRMEFPSGVVGPTRATVAQARQDRETG